MSFNSSPAAALEPRVDLRVRRTDINVPREWHEDFTDGELWLHMSPDDELAVDQFDQHTVVLEVVGIGEVHLRIPREDFNTIFFAAL